MINPTCWQQTNVPRVLISKCRRTSAARDVFQFCGRPNRGVVHERIDSAEGVADRVIMRRVASSSARSADTAIACPPAAASSSAVACALASDLPACSATRYPRGEARAAVADAAPGAGHRTTGLSIAGDSAVGSIIRERAPMLVQRATSSTRWPILGTSVFQPRSWCNSAAKACAWQARRGSRMSVMVVPAVPPSVAVPRDRHGRSGPAWPRPPRAPARRGRRCAANGPLPARPCHGCRRP